MKSKENIPIVFCHDNNYVIQSAVTINSILLNSDNNFIYDFHILHQDISKRNQEKLAKEIDKFNNSKISFFKVDDSFESVIESINNKAHYSKEMFYKLILASNFPQYKKAIVTDVDVVFLGDISKQYLDFDIKQNYYVAVVKMVNKMDQYLDIYKKDFNENEFQKIQNGIGAGYCIFNLEKLRKDNIEEKYIDFLKKNHHRLIQPEQDVINLCSDSKIKFLPLQNMTCSYMYDLYDKNNLEDAENFTKLELKEAMDSPIQLHYATHIKPWKDLSCTKSEIWLEYLLKTNFVRHYLEKFHKPKKITEKIKNIFTINFKYSKKKYFRFRFDKIKNL